MRWLLHISLPVHHAASYPYSLVYLSNPRMSFSVKCSLFETENLTNANGYIFSRALCHKMILLSPFSETENGIAEIGRSQGSICQSTHFRSTWSQYKSPLTASEIMRNSPLCLAEGGCKLGTTATSST